MIAIPAGDAVGEIEAFRRRHDPLAEWLPGHVTLVFPFSSTLSALQVATHLRRVAGQWPPIPIRLQGVGAYRAEWVHLRVTRGAASVAELHDRLYRRALAPFLRTDLPYEPHLTLGRAIDPGQADVIMTDATNRFARPLDLVLRALTLIALPPSGPVRHECELGLG